MVCCIWCKTPNSDEAIEHIIPEALGCPEGFILCGGAVCQKCNNDLGHLDQAVIDEFDIAAFMAGMPRKRGKLPQIHNRGNMFGTWDGSGKVISINMGRHPVRSKDGRILTRFGKSRRNIKASIRRAGDVGDVSFSMELGRDPKFVRGIVKIAFTSLAYFISPENVLPDRFDSIREFVVNGRGVRKILHMASLDTNYKNQVWPPYFNKKGEYAMTFRLAFVEFCVDFTTDMTLLRLMKDKSYELYGTKGWGYLPL